MFACACQTFAEAESVGRINFHVSVRRLILIKEKTVIYSQPEKRCAKLPADEGIKP